MLALYNPGPAQKRQVKIYVPDLDLKITSWSNTSVAGDIICTNCSSVVVEKFINNEIYSSEWIDLNGKH